MTKADKLVQRFLRKPKDLTWEELVKLLAFYGFNELNTGKTSGSARKFEDSQGIPINVHKPHPGNIVKGYVIKLVIETLQKEGLL